MNNLLNDTHIKKVTDSYLILLLTYNKNSSN